MLTNKVNKQHKASERLAAERDVLEKAGRISSTHWLVLIISLALTLYAWNFSRQQVQAQALQRFLFEAENTVEQIRERMELYENALWAGVSAIDARGGEINYLDWRKYAHSLNIDVKYPGINGIGVIFNVHPDDMDTYLAKERTDRPDYRTHPPHEKNEFWPITYIEPEGPNKNAVGLDMSFETNRYTAVTRARDEGTAQLTGPIVLVQDEKKTPGFLLFTPFYANGSKPDSVAKKRESIVGVTYAPFIMYKLIKGTLAHQNRSVDLRITDGDDLLFDDAQEPGDHYANGFSNFKTSITIPLYGRQWTFDITPNARFKAQAKSAQSNIILIGGLFIDTLLLVLFILISRANRGAIAFADHLTSDLIRKIGQLETSVRDLDNFANVAAHDLKSPLQGVCLMVSLCRDDIEDREVLKSHFDLIQGRITRMKKLVDDLLYYARIGRLDDACKSVDSAGRIKSLFEKNSASQGFTLNLDENLPQISTAVPLFEKVIEELITNAIKHHTGDIGEISITVESGGAFYIFRVTDDGPGIEPKYHQKIFKTLFTIKSKDEVEGSGMGLCIAKRCCEHVGGDIKVESDGRKGCTFFLYWPKCL